MEGRRESGATAWRSKAIGTVGSERPRWVCHVPAPGHLGGAALKARGDTEPSASPVRARVSFTQRLESWLHLISHAPVSSLV